MSYWHPKGDLFFPPKSEMYSRFLNILFLFLRSKKIVYSNSNNFHELNSTDR
jgi:hypothetical protein